MITLLAAAAQKVNPIGTLVPIVLLFGAMYFLMIRPQQRRRREVLELLRAIEVGDEIETVAGIFGTIRRLDDDHAWIEIAEGITVKMSRGAIRRKVTADEDSDASS